MLEQFIDGRELTVAIMGNPPATLPVIEIITSNWYDYNAKYEAEDTEKVCPADIPAKIKDEIQSLGLKAFKAIGCKDLARADFIWNKKDSKLYFLEINTIPGMTVSSLAPRAAQAVGLNFSEFLDKLIKGAVK